MTTIVCKRSGIEFQADSKRVKQHPTISGWLQQANKEGWYSACVEAIDSIRESGASQIEEFDCELSSVRKETLAANELRQSESQAYWGEVKRSQKERKAQNSALRKAGYSWQKVKNDMFEISSDESEWVLFDPSENPVSLSKALKAIGWQR